MGAAFGPAIILALYWRRFNFWGALTAILVGNRSGDFVVVPSTRCRLHGARSDALSGLWEVMKDNSGGWWSIQPATPGFLIATPAAVLVTLLTATPRTTDDGAV